MQQPGHQNHARRSGDKAPPGVRVTSNDGLRSATGATAAEAIAAYVREYGDARYLLLVGLDIRDLEVPENTDFSGTEFRRCSIHDFTARKCLFENSVFRNCERIVGLDFDGSDLTGLTIKQSKIRKFSAEGACLTSSVLTNSKIEQADLDNANLSASSIENTIISRSTMREANLADARINRSHVIFSDLYRVDLSGSINRFSSFKNCEGSFSRWRRAVCERVDFSEFKFLPEKRLSRPGRRNDLDFCNPKSIGRTKLADFVESLYVGSAFTGCRYDGVRIPNYKTFPPDAKIQKVARFVARAAFATAGYIAIESGFDYLRGASQNLIHNPTFLGNVARFVVPHLTHISPSAIGAIGATVLLGAAVAADLVKEEGIEVVDDRFVTSLRRGLTVRSELGAAVHNIRDVVILAGSRRSLKPIRAAILAARQSWPIEKGHGHRHVFRPSYRSLVLEGGEIMVCDRASLEAAARVAASSIEMNEPPRQDITIVPAAPMAGETARIVSAQIASNRETRIAWHVDRPPTDIVIGWNHAGHLIQESSVPPMPARQLRRLISRVPEIARVRGHGLEGAVAILFDEIAGQAGYFAELAGAMRHEAAADAGPHDGAIESGNAQDTMPGIAEVADEAEEEDGPVHAPV